MAWPSGTKASTANCDSGTDLISAARSDIKQNIDNVNSIIDEFNISSPSNGDLLQYSSSSGKWEQVASSSVGSATEIAHMNLSTGEELISGNNYRRAFTIGADPNTIIQEDSTGQFTFDLAVGTYLFLVGNEIVEDGESNINLHNDTDDSLSLTFTRDEIGTTGEAIYKNVSPVVSVTGSTKTFSFRQDNANSNFRDASVGFTVIKIA